MTDVPESQTTHRRWDRIVRAVGGVWSLWRLDVVIHDRGLMVLWTRDGVIWREWEWRLT